MALVVLRLIVALAALLHVLLFLDQLPLIERFIAAFLHHTLKSGERIQALLRVVVHNLVRHLLQLVVVDNSFDGAHMLATWLIRRCLRLFVWKRRSP